MNENKIKPEKKDDFFLKLFATQGLTIPTAGADIGLNNLLTLVFNQGSKGAVISNQRLEKRINLMDQKIDTLKASLATPRQRALQKQQETTTLSKSESIELRMLQKTLFNHVGLQKLLEERASWLKNALHTASRGVVDLLVEQGIEALVVGRNKGWKQESNLGKNMNRRLQVTAHAELISMLCYKCEDAGILFIETEESYTSKTSFATGEVLKEYQKKENSERKTELINLEQKSTLVLFSNSPDPRAEVGTSVPIPSINPLVHVKK